MVGNYTDFPELYFQLDAFQKLMIVLGSALFLLLVLMILVCILNPSCCLHKYFPIQYANSEKMPMQPVYGAMYDPAMHSGKKGHSIRGHHGPPWHPMVPLRESELSDWSDISMPEIIEMKQDHSSRTRKSSRTSDYSSSASTVTSPVQYESRLSYGVTLDRSHGKLYVRVIQLGNFRVTDPDGAMAPYVKVRIYKAPKHFFTFKLKSSRELPLNHLEAEAHTKIQRRTDNPVFNETFDVTVDDVSDISNYTLKFLVCDFDKFSRHVVVGEVTNDLSKLELVSGQELLFNDLLSMPQEEHLGEVHVALMYLPTAEKLSLMILNARNLRALEGPKKNTETYFKITLMYDGRPLKKTKTAAKSNDLNPVFNETFVFDVPAYQLDKVYFSIAGLGVEKDKEDGRHLLGRVYIGVNFQTDARAQWLEMVNNARKQVACWHKLQS